MAYPQDKETFRRVVNQELPTIPGDVVDENDQNKPADFLERLQDTLGLNITGGETNLNSRVNLIETAISALPNVEIVSVQSFDDYPIILGTPQDFPIALDNTRANSIYLFLMFGCIHSGHVDEAGLNCRFYRLTNALTRTARFVTAGINKYSAVVHTLFYQPAIENNIIYKLTLTAVLKSVTLPQAEFFIIKLLK